MSTPLRVRKGPDMSMEELVLAVVEAARKENSIEASRIAAEFLKENGNTVVKNKDGSYSVILENSDTRKDPCEVLICAVRWRIKNNIEGDTK